MTREHKWREVGWRLKRARTAVGYTQPQVAEVVGVTSTMISLWERGRSMPRADRLQSLARLYGVPVSDLLGGEEAGQSPKVRESRAEYTLSSGALEEMILASVPIVGVVSAGGLVEAWQEDLGTLEVPSTIIREAPRAFGLRVSGSSLAAEWIYDGAIVIVDPDAEFIDGKIYAVAVDSAEIAARRVYDSGPLLKIVTGDGRVDEFPKDRVSIIGRIRWSFREH